MIWRDDDGIPQRRSAGSDLATIAGALILVAGAVLILGGFTIW